MSSKSTFKHPFPASLFATSDSMMRFIADYWKLNRSAVSPETDKLIKGISSEIPGEIIEAKSGDETLSWIVPKTWTVRSATLKDSKGAVIADYAEHPMILWMHSVGFKGEVSRAELQEHLFSDPHRPDEIQFHYRNGFKYDAKAWGFSLPHNRVLALTDDKYFVDIDADLNDEGTIKVFNGFLPGEKKETIFFMAHTCHPGQVADGLANIAVLIELFRYIECLKNRKRSYRFLFGPEFFGAAAYLEKAPAKEVGLLQCGIYCDMLSCHEPIGWQTSFQGDSIIDRVIENVMKTHASAHIKRGYRGLWGNDETFFNGPGLNIPTAGIGRTMPREYHYDSDNFENADPYHLVESLWILRRIVDVFETNFIPARKFKGPLYLSRYGLYIDPTRDREGADKLEAIQILMDGARSVFDIANECGADYFFTRDIIENMVKLGVVDKT